jgi:hypothetical protein
MIAEVRQLAQPVRGPSSRTNFPLAKGPPRRCPGKVSIMYTTRQVLGALRQANPGEAVTEERIRRSLRRGAIPPPSMFAGRFLWTDGDVRALAKALGLMPPEGSRLSAYRVPDSPGN